MSFVLLAGRPGSGKSQFCSWLAEHRGFTHIETDDIEVWGEWAPHLLVDNAIQAQATLEAAGSVAENVVIEWGFMPQYLPHVRLLSYVGFSSWFFDADEPTARQLWRARRPDEPWESYDAQTERLRVAWLALTRFYRGRLIRTVDAGPTYMPAEEIAEVLLGQQ